MKTVGVHMKKIALLILLVAVLHETSTAKYLKCSKYAVAEIGGTATFARDSILRGVFIPYEFITLETDNPESFLFLKWNRIKIGDLGKYPALRLSLVSDLVTFQTLEITLANGELISTIDLSLGNSFQLLQSYLPVDKIGIILKQGIYIRAKGKGPSVKLFGRGGEVPQSSMPHLLLPGNLKPYEEFLNRMASRSCLTAYGWEEGCVVDGLARLASSYPEEKRYSNTLKDHLKLLFPSDTSVNHKMNSFSIEETSCIAQLAFHNPYHPEIASVMNFWESKKGGQGSINDGKTIVAEGNYTVAWPLAVISDKLKRPDLLDEALSQLRIRRDSLVDMKGAIWLRNINGKKTYRLWSRGIAWYLLGMTKVLDIMHDPPQDLVSEVQRTCSYLLKLQDADGMWKVFADSPETAPESSGTSGIAAAMAIGIRRGWLNNEVYKASVEKAFEGLSKRLTPDGYLDNVAQSNKGQGGEKFQRKTKGTTCQWGMGMFAQLIAEMNLLN